LNNKSKDASPKNIKRANNNLWKLLKVVIRVALLVPELNRFTPSKIAFSAVRVARLLMGLE